MIEFKRSESNEIAIHYVGNKGLGEEIVFANMPNKIGDEWVKETIYHFFLNTFKSDVYFQFRKPDAIKIYDVQSYVRDVFDNPSTMFENSKKIAQRLYDQSNHPKIKGGDFFMTYIKDCVVDGELCDAIGIFKSENKETYLKLNQNLDNFEVEAENGININKLDKGCLIFNVNKEDGYKISIIDNSHKIAQAALYWTEDFLGVKLCEDRFFHTNNMLATINNFCEEVLTQENNVEPVDQMLIKDRSLNYFKDKDRFNLEEFQAEVLSQPELIDSFKEYRTISEEVNHVKNDVEDFEISATAVKKQEKYFRGIIKLDKNFHLYIHGRHDLVQKGFDEEKGMKFYKVFYNNEE